MREIVEFDRGRSQSAALAAGHQGLGRIGEREFPSRPRCALTHRRLCFPPTALQESAGADPLQILEDRPLVAKPHKDSARSSTRQSQEDSRTSYSRFSTVESAFAPLGALPYCTNKLRLTVASSIRTARSIESAFLRSIICSSRKMLLSSHIVEGRVQPQAKNDLQKRVHASARLR